MSNIYKGSVILKTQQEVDDFGAKKYKHIEGSLIIGDGEIINNSITNLDALQGLSYASSITITLNEALKNLNGLSELTSTSSIYIIGNGMIVHLDGFANLSIVEANLTIYANHSLTDFCGLTKLIENEGLPSRFEISSNAYNPTKEDLINGDCSN